MNVMETPSPLLEKSRPALLEAPRRSGRNVLVGFLAALQFLTITPPLIRRLLTPEEMGRSVGFFPLVGLMLGALLFGLDEAARLLWPPEIRTALVLLAWVLVTGALHIDGFLDTCDGLFGGNTPEDRLRIMKDERVGAFAAVGGVFLLLIKYLALAAVQDRLGAFLLAPMLGRWGMVLAIVFFPYARPEGLGGSMKDHAGWREVVLATIVAAAACWLAGQERGLLALALSGGATWCVARFTLKRLPGLTGDIYGATCEMLEVLVLLVFAARIPA
jgi:adenosylcobinamide-GDP ribazoletransferase